MVPHVQGNDAYWTHEDRAASAESTLREQPDYETIHMPRNSATGFVSAFFAVVLGFALIWHIWWHGVLGLVGAFAHASSVFAWRDQDRDTRSRPAQVDGRG